MKLRKLPSLWCSRAARMRQGSLRYVKIGANNVATSVALESAKGSLKPAIAEGLGDSGANMPLNAVSSGNKQDRP